MRSVGPRPAAAVAARAAHDVSPEGERLRREEQACDRAIVRIVEALRKRRQQTAGPKGPRRGSGGKNGEEPRDPARKLGLLMDLLAPYRDESPTDPVARPADRAGGHGRGGRGALRAPSPHPPAGPG